MTTSIVDNGVNTEALLGARDAFADLPEIARFQWRGIQLRSVLATIAAAMDLHGILGADPEVRNGFSGVRVEYDFDPDAPRTELEALVAQSQKRSAVYDVLTNPTAVTATVS